MGKQTYGRHAAVLLTKAQMSGVPLLTCAGMLSQSPFGPGRYQVALSAGDAVRRKKLPRYVLQQYGFYTVLLFYSCENHAFQ